MLLAACCWPPLTRKLPEARGQRPKALKIQNIAFNVDKLTYAGNLENLSSVGQQFPERYVFIQADICDSSALKEIFETYKIDTICNFAAESHVDRSIAAPDAFIKTNIEGTFRLLEVARQRIDRLALFHSISGENDSAYDIKRPGGEVSAGIR
ncbi:MAG: GDP-mannose 4,6-dehydratase [Desulfobacterales bacterium]